MEHSGESRRPVDVQRRGEEVQLETRVGDQASTDNRHEHSSTTTGEREEHTNEPTDCTQGRTVEKTGQHGGRGELG